MRGAGGPGTSATLRPAPSASAPLRMGSAAAGLNDDTLVSKLGMAGGVSTSWTTLGRHPMLELRHTVDDRLMLATQPSFLALRAFFHRRGDTAVVFSDVVRDMGGSTKKPGSHAPDFQAAFGGSTNGMATGGASGMDRAFVVTDRNFYIISLPRSALFAPPANGSVYSVKEFAKMCTFVGSTHCMLQFVGGMLLLQLASKKDLDRCSQAVFTVTGVPAEPIQVSDLTAGGRRMIGALGTMLGPEAAAGALESIGSAIADGTESVTSSGAPIGPSGGGHNGFQNNSSISRHDSDRAGGTPLAHGKSFKRQGTGLHRTPTAGALRANGPGAMGNSTVDTMLRFILDGGDTASQSAYESMFPEIGVQCVPMATSVATQTVVQTSDATTSPVKKALPAAHGGSQGAAGGRLLGRGLSEETASESDASDFDTAELWRSLRERSVSNVGGISRGLSGIHGQMNAPRRQGSTVGGSASASSPFRAGPSARDRAVSSMTAATTSSSVEAYPYEEAYHTAAAAVTTTTPPSAAGGVAALGNPQSFDAWLGILAQYKDGLLRVGVDSISAASRLDGGELERAMDAAGMTRPGHRVLFASKINVTKLARDRR